MDQIAQDKQDRMESKSIESLLLDIFGGNDYYSESKEGLKGDIYYQPVDNPLTEEDISDHLHGERILGSYQLIRGTNVVRWLGWDVDSPDLKIARDMAVKIVKNITGIPHIVEFSGRKGYHILVFLESPMPASDAKKITHYIREKEGLLSSGENHVECYPKQDSLTKDKPKGSLIKIPLGKHPKTHDRSRFIDISNGWENGPDLNPQELLRYRAKNSDVINLMTQDEALQETLIDLVSEFWSSGKRHELSLYLCGFLAHEGWGLEQTKEFVRDICIRSGDTEEFNRMQTVDNTFQRHKEGKSIRGRQGLGEILPVAAMQRITELVSRLRAPDTVSQIDDIRYIKGKPKLEAARLAAVTIWGTLNDNGCKIFQNDLNSAYWYDAETHLVTEEGTEKWRSLLNKFFGLNPVDSFSRLVYSELRLRIVREAQIVPVRNRTYWDELKGKLFINLGGPEVYIVSGENVIEQAYNGECGIMFLTNDSGKYIIPDLMGERIDTWKYLVEDISFTTSTEAPASPDEQKELLKAWILAFFFQELMPTKPILAIIGAAGSGKTTALRRILRVLEDPDGDVLGVPTDKQDSFRASIGSHKLLTIDNMEKSGAWWMVDILNKLSTGNTIELRKLYETNSKFMIKPECFVGITAVNMPFSEETLFSRLLILETDKINDPLPEYILQKKIRENSSAIWGDILQKLGTIVSELRKIQVVKPPTKSRLADFTVFCARIKSCSVVHGEILFSGLLSIVDSQLKQLRESSQAVLLLEEWLSLKPQEASEWRTFSQLFDILSHMALIRKMNFNWKNAMALYRHFSTLEDRLRKDFSAEMHEEFNTSINRNIVKIRFNTYMVDVREESSGSNGSGFVIRE